LDHLLFAAYLILFAWLVTKIKFFTKSGLSPAQLIIIFLLKVMAGIFYGWIGIYYGELAQMVDTWAFHHQSITEYKLLLNKPLLFFTSLFNNTYEAGYGEFLSSNNSWWNDLHGSLFIKVLALFNLASFGNYYINVIFYSFLSFIGPMAVYRVMKHAFPNNQLAVLITVFLIPSFLYWTSGIHKDGLIFLGLALIIYQTYFAIYQQKLPIYRLAIILLGLLLIIGFRNYLIINLLPALGAWVFAQKLAKRVKPILVFSIAYLFFILIFFTAGYLTPKLNFPQAVTAKQQAFLKLEGNSSVPTTKLEPTFKSFINNAPQAVTISLLRPYPTDVKHLLSLAAAVEINLILLLFLLLIFFYNKSMAVTPFVCFCIFLALSLFITIGYTVNFLGAIVRYRSILFPLFLTPVVASINWNKINSILFDIKNNHNV
jgi:hypothetical protein